MLTYILETKDTENEDSYCYVIQAESQPSQTTIHKFLVERGITADDEGNYWEEVKLIDLLVDSVAPGVKPEFIIKSDGEIIELDPLEDVPEYVVSS